MVNFIEFPVFDGVSGDLKQWILWLEEFFVRERFTAMEKMNLAQSLLEGEAESWFYSLKRSIFRSWEHLVDLLIWWFGDVNEFGDFIDPELFRLWDKNARILQARRVEKRRKRMETTSLNLQESISNQQKIVEESAENVAENLDEKASEKKLISQFQVPVSSLEPSLRFSTESLVVSEARPSEIVSTNRVHSQSVLDCVKNKTNAYQVFDKTSPHKERLKPKTKRKLRLSLKTWMFKFKHTSQKCKSLDVKFFSVEEISWLPTDPKEIYRSCVDNEFKEVVAGCGKKLFDRFQTSPSYALDVVNKTSKPWETHTPFTSTHVASVNSVSFAVGTADKFELCVGHETGIMSLTLLLHSGFAGDRLTELDFHVSEIHGLLVFPWNLMLLEFLLFLHLEDKVCLSAASNSCYGWMVFDRGKNHIITGDVITLVLLDNVEVGSKGLAYDGCVILGMNGAGGGRCNAELLATGQQMQRTDLLSFCCSCQNHILVAIYTEITMHTELDEKILWLLLFKKDRVMAADLGRQAGLEQISKGVKHALLHTPFQMISSVGTFVLLAQRVFQKLAAQLSKHFEILIKRIQPALYQLNCFSGSLWDSSITCSKFGHTTNMQLIVVCLLYSWGICIWFTNSWERKFCKDWRFKFKYNIRIWEAFDYGTI